MEDIPVKNPGSFLLSSEFNSFFDGSKNAITDSGQALLTIDDRQLSRAMAINAGGATFYSDSGSVTNAYVVSTTGSLRAPDVLFQGMLVRFRIPNSTDNTGPATLIVAGLGGPVGIPILSVDGTSALTGGEITSLSDTTMRYDVAAASFILSTLSVTNATSTVKGLKLLKNNINMVNSPGDLINDIDFSGGNFQFSDNTGEDTVGAMTKRLDAVFSTGTGAGGLDTGVKTADTTYHCYSVHNPTTGFSDYAYSVSASGPTLVGNLTPFTKHERVWSIVTDSLNNIREFTQADKRCILKVPALVFGPAALTTINYPVIAPNGLSTIALLYSWGANSTVQAALYSPLSSVPTIANLAGIFLSGEWDATNMVKYEILTNTSFEIAAVVLSGSSPGFRLSSWGWIDYQLRR